MIKRTSGRGAAGTLLISGLLTLGSSMNLLAGQKSPGAGTSAQAVPGETRHDDTAEVRVPDPAVLAARIQDLGRQVAELTRQVEILMARDAARACPGADRIAPQPSSVPVQLRPETAPAPDPPAEMRTALPPAETPPSQAKPAPAETAPKIAAGPFRFSGDFRLRLDGIVRPAYNSPDGSEPSLQHAQNIRGRYRFRFNVDTDLNPYISFHGQLATGPVNNPLTLDQDFSATIARHPFMLNEAWVDFHPRKGMVFQGGRVQEVFADNLRFLFDDDLALNGFNQRIAVELKKPFAGIKRLEWRSGQYILSNPDVAIVTPGNLGPTGAVIGSAGRAAQLFHQGLVVEQVPTPKIAQQFGADIQLYRNPNQIQFASTAAGVPIIVQNGLGITLSGPIKGVGNATTTSGGAMYTARNFQVARLSYRLDFTGLKSMRQEYPLTVNLQVARNVGTGQSERDALLANLKIGRIKGRWDHSFLYMFAIKGANSMISQLTDDDLGTSSGVNIRSHFFRFDLGLAKGIQLQSLFFMQNQLRNSGQFPNFFVPLGAYAPRQYRFQEQIVFIF
jgi:hypothetical protein